MILGYATNQKAYKLWDMNKGEVTVSRDVVCDESAAAHNASDDTHAIEIGDNEEEHYPNDQNASSSSESSYADEQQNTEEDNGEPSTPPRESLLYPDERSHIASDGRRITQVESLREQEGLQDSAECHRNGGNRLHCRPSLKKIR